jgi:hypothetical protein
MLDQHPESAPRQVTTPQVPQVDPAERKVGFDSLAVLVEQRGEARYFPESWPVMLFQSTKNAWTSSMVGSMTFQTFS